MHNSFLRRFTVLPERQRGGGGLAGMRFCMRVCLARSPNYEDTETRTSSCPQPFFLSLSCFFLTFFFIVSGEPLVTPGVEWGSIKFPQMFYSWTQEGKRKKKRRDYTSASTFSEKMEAKKHLFFWGICKLSVSRWGVISIQQQQDFLVTVATHNMV